MTTTFFNMRGFSSSGRFLLVPLEQIPMPGIALAGLAVGLVAAASHGGAAAGRARNVESDQFRRVPRHRTVI